MIPYDGKRAHEGRMRTYVRPAILPLLAPRNENIVGAHPLLMRAFRWLARRFMRDRRILHNHLLCALAHFLGSNTLRTDTLFTIMYIAHCLQS